jgi:hypothetical protein
MGRGILKVVRDGLKFTFERTAGVYRDHDRKLAETMEHLPAPEGFHGAVFTIAGRISGADLSTN